MRGRSSLRLMAAFLLALLAAQAPFTAYAAERDASRTQAHSASSDGMTADDVAKALEVFGEDIANDMAKVVESVFAKQGRPAAMIIGEEASGSFIVGYRKGSGKIIFPGQAADTAQDIFWNAPSVGFNVGASASKVAILVYGADSREAVLRRFASVQGSYHLVAGASVSFLRSNLDMEDRSAITLAYITAGVGLDAGVAIESVLFSDKNRWL